MGEGRTLYCKGEKEGEWGRRIIHTAIEKKSMREG